MSEFDVALVFEPEPPMPIMLHPPTATAAKAKAATKYFRMTILLYLDR